MVSVLSLCEKSCYESLKRVRLRRHLPGYSISITARRSVSLAENRPNCISWIVRVGALE